MSLADPTPDRTDADRAGPSPPQETVTPPEVDPVAAPPLAVTTAMEEDADPAGPGARRRDAPFAPATRDARSEPGALGSIGVRAVTARTSCFASRIGIHPESTRCIMYACRCRLDASCSCHR